ncbi:MAG: hypothetical protein COU72_01720, partial [Parcubacteria group bacterium CG10_big_fil_rev_8_21_14_0_10_41_35]
NAAGTNLSNGDSISATLAAGSANARALSSSTSLSTSSIAGNTLTVRTGTLVTAENTGVNDASASAPTGVKGDANVLIGSFTLTAGSGEGVTITQITMKDDADGSTTGSSLADVFQNLRLESGGPADMNGNYAAGTAIGQTKGSLTDTAATTYNFNPSPAMKIAASAQIVVNVYADVLNSATSTQLNTINNDTTGIIYPSVVTATGNSTTAVASDTDGTAAGLQKVYLAANGSLTVENVAGSAQAKANIAYEGQTDVELYKFKITAFTEDIDITRFLISDTIASETLGATSANGKPTSTLKNFKLFDGTTQIGTALSSLSLATALPTLGGYLDFNIGTDNAYTISAGQEKTITLKGTVNSFSGISSGSTHTFSLNTDPLGSEGTAKAVTARGVGSSVDVSGPTTGVAGNAITIRRAYPLVERLALTTSTLSGGSTSQIAAAKFKVTAVGGQVRLKKMTFDVSLTDTTTSTALSLNNFKLYRNGSLMGSTEYSIFDGTGTAQADELSHSGTAALTTLALGGGLGTHTGNALNSTSTRVVVMLGTQRSGIADGATTFGSGEELIGAGTSNTYELKIDVANAHVGASTDSDSISVQLLGDETETAVLTGDLGPTATNTYRQGIVGLSTTNYNFLWSDYSANIGDHTSVFKEGGTGKDWTHGYQVPASSTQDAYIPLDAWRLSKS